VKRLWLGIIGLLMVGGAAGMGTVVVKGVVQLKSIQASIREQEGIKQEVQEEKRKYREKTEQAKRELAEIPDSLGASRSGRLMDRSFGLAKAEEILEQKSSRTDKRLGYLEAKKHEVKTHLVRWSIVLGGAEFMLIGGVVVLARRLKPGR